MFTKKLLSTAAAVALLVPFAAGCGNGEDKEAAKSLSSSLQKAQTKLTGDAKITKKQADCIGEGMVDKVGVDKLKKVGILDKDGKATTSGNPKMGKEDADKTVDAITGCIDLKKTMEDSMSKSAGTLPDKVKKCMSDALDDKSVKAIMSSSLQGKTDSAEATKLQQKMMSCAQGAMSQ